MAATATELLSDLCYAKVTSDCGPPGGVPLYRVPLEVEPGVVVPMMSIHVSVPKDWGNQQREVLGRTQTPKCENCVTQAQKMKELCLKCSDCCNFTIV